MTPRRAPVLDRIRAITASLLLAPCLAFAQQATDATSKPATPASMAGTSAAPAPAAHEDAETPRRPGETTTGRPPAPALPAPAATPATTAPPTAPLPGDGAAAADTTPPVATAPVSPTSSAPLSEAPRVSMPAPMPTASTASPGAGGLLKTIMALMLVLGLLAGLAWLMKRYGPKMSGGSANLRVVGALNLGGRERIMVVEVGDQWIVVGAAPGRVNALHTMLRQETDLTPAAAHGAIPANNFSDWLKKTIDKRNAS
jgi:flagellar protein FliO/FliZ